MHNKNMEFMDFYTDSLEKKAQAPGTQPPMTPPAGPPPGQAPTAQPGQPPIPSDANTVLEVPPETNTEEQTSAVTCDSACQFAQNPEKRCMLNSITFTQDDKGLFSCSQFQPAMEAAPAPEML